VAKIVVRSERDAEPRVMAARSFQLAPADGDVDAELTVATLSGEAIVLGAFQRPGDVDPAVSGGLPVLRRGSGGAAVRVGPGTIWVNLALARPDALVPCEPSKLLNRYVRPLLKALGRSGAPASYFDRDWVAVAHRPAAMVAFAHDATTGACAFHAFVAVTTPFALGDRASYRGKSPGTLADLVGKSDPAPIAAAIAEAYEAHAAAEPRPQPAAFARSANAPPREAHGRGGGSRAERVRGALGPHKEEADPPWGSVLEEAIGPVAAGRDARGRMRVGGDLMASRDAIARLEDGLAALGPGASEEDVGALVDATLSAPGVALFGVRSLRSIRDVILAALAARAQ